MLKLPIGANRRFFKERRHSGWRDGDSCRILPNDARLYVLDMPCCRGDCLLQVAGLFSWTGKYL